MASLVELVGASVKLTRRAGVFWASCPFHMEKTSSFKIEFRQGKERFHCFGCGASGDAADWIMLTRKVSYAEAKRILGEERVRPDPGIIEARRAEAWRRRILARYRDNNPDCACPEWLIVVAPAPQWFRVRREVPQRRLSDEELYRITADGAFHAKQREMGGE